MKYSRFSLKDVENMEKLYVSGKTLDKIGKIYNVNYNTVSNLIRGKNITSDGIAYKSKYRFISLKNKSKRSKFNLKDVEEMEKLRIHGETLDKIGKIYGITPMTVSNLIKGKVKTREGIKYAKKE